MRKVFSLTNYSNFKLPRFPVFPIRNIHFLQPIRRFLGNEGQRRQPVRETSRGYDYPAILREKYPLLPQGTISTIFSMIPSSPPQSTVRVLDRYSKDDYYPRRLGTLAT